MLICTNMKQLIDTTKINYLTDMRIGRVITYLVALMFYSIFCFVYFERRAGNAALCHQASFVRSMKYLVQFSICIRTGCMCVVLLRTKSR